MSFSITLYQNTSDNRVVSKSLGNALELTGTLRNECSITEPSIEIQATNLAGYNYMYIPSFNRYYYIKDIVSVRNNLWRVDCKVDVLMTYASGIRSARGVVKRQRTQYNLYLEDGELPIYQDTFTVTKNFPNALEEESYLLVVAG